MIIYKITNLLNGKSYVGQTVRKLSERLKEHRKSKTTAIGRALRKYGNANFKIEVLAECKSIDELNDKEIYFIDKLKTLKPNGYNLTVGGLNCLASEETKRKLSDLKKGSKHPLFGTHRSQETKDAIAKGRVGLVVSDETRAKISAANSGKAKSKEHSKKISKSLKGKSKSEDHRSNIAKALGVKVKCNETGKVFDSIKDAAAWLNVNANAIKWPLSKEGRKCKGFTFSYSSESL
jgi:group I intron endonuclease